MKSVRNKQKRMTRGGRNENEDELVSVENRVGNVFNPCLLRHFRHEVNETQTREKITTLEEDTEWKREGEEQKKIRTLAREEVASSLSLSLTHIMM